MTAANFSMQIPPEGADDELERLRVVVHHLARALESRPVIEQAKGILMARERCTEDEAFEMLRRASQRTNRRLADLARELVLKVSDRTERAHGFAYEVQERAAGLHETTARLSDTLSRTRKLVASLGDGDGAAPTPPDDTPHR